MYIENQFQQFIGKIDNLLEEGIKENCLKGHIFYNEYIKLIRTLLTVIKKEFPF